MLAYGECLTLTRLWAAGFQQFAVRLAFLSCCEGGMTGRTFDSDEFAGLPAALLQLGAAAVIAAQWAVHDDTARVFADASYRRYFNVTGAPPTSPSRALAETRRWMRSVTVSTLIDEDYLSYEQAVELFVTSTPQTRRLRRFEAMDALNGGASLPARRPAALNLHMRPYANACHWAGWTLFGQ